MWIFTGILAYILFWLACIVFYTIYYLTQVIQVTSFSQVLYTLNAGAEGAQGTIGAAVAGFFEQNWLLLIIGTLVFGVYMYFCIKRIRLKKKGRRLFADKKWNLAFNLSSVAAIVICAALAISGVFTGLDAVGYEEYVKNANRVSELYEDHFVQPDDVKLTFPEKKRNVIHIVMESMESTYASRKNGGGYEEDLIPNLTALQQEGENFAAADNPDVQGAYVTNNSGWTIAGLVAQSAGVPLNVGNQAFVHNLDSDVQFMPNLTAMGDILKENGYKNYFMCGSEGAYAGRTNYYKQHGDYEVLDYDEAIREKKIPSDYRVWWGFEDEKLFDWAKAELDTISKNEEPFNFTMLTADTHFVDGYKCKDCTDEFDEQYKNVIHCSDRKVGAFIDWLKEQPFYENTTIILSGDHLSMDGSVGPNIPSDYSRKAYFTVLNGPEYTLNQTREYCTLDIFPTIIEAMGIDIEGHRLGLGTSLYANEQTLIENLGLLAFNAELASKSDYYNNVIMSGDQTNGGNQKDDTPKNEMVEQPDGNFYEENADQFKDPDYYYPPAVNNNIYVPPVVTPPSDPGYAPDPGGNDPGNNSSGQAPNLPPAEPPVNPGDNTGDDSQGGSTTPPGGGDTGGSTTPPGGGDTGGTTPPGGGDQGGTVTPPGGGDQGTVTPPVEQPAPPASDAVQSAPQESAVPLQA